MVFESQATNLVEVADTNQETDLFARDLETGTTHLISPNAAGTATGNGRSEQAAMTPDGKYVAFVSTATDLVAGVTNRRGDVYVRDLNAGQTFWASTNVGAAMPDAAGYECFGPALSADGRFVVFKATGIGVTNEILLVHHDLETGVNTVLTRETAADTWPQLSADGRFVASENTNQVCRWDQETGSNVLVSVAMDGINPASAAAQAPVMTPDGTEIVFLSPATTLVDGVINGVWQIYQRDLEHAVTTLVSADNDGQPGAVHLDVALPALSPDGQWVAFSSRDDTLVPDDLNGMEDVFVRDLTAGVTRLVSARDPTLMPSTSSALSAREVGAISADGKQIGFVSLDGNLARGDADGWQDAFVQDMGTGSVVPLSVDSNGSFNVTNVFARNLTVSAHGEAAAFLWHNYDNAVPISNPGDVYSYDFDSGQALLVNADSAGSPIRSCRSPVVSPDGRCVAFCCNADVSDLVPGAYGSYNNYYNVYLRDMWAGTNALISQDWYGDGLWDDSATNCVFSPDGHWILFATAASYVTADTPDGVFSLYARNLVEQTTTLISIGPEGQRTWGY